MTNSKTLTKAETNTINLQIANLEAALDEETNSVARFNILKDLDRNQELLDAGSWPE